MNLWFNYTDTGAFNIGTPDRAIAPIPDAGGKMTMPYHTQHSAPAPLTTSLQSGSPRDKSLAFGCAVHSPHRQKWFGTRSTTLRSLAYIQRGLDRGFPVVVTTIVDRQINDTWI